MCVCVCVCVCVLRAPQYSRSDSPVDTDSAVISCRILSFQSISLYHHVSNSTGYGTGFEGCQKRFRIPLRRVNLFMYTEKSVCCNVVREGCKNTMKSEMKISVHRCHET